MKFLIAVGSDFLGQWLPASLATALPEVAMRMVGKLWVDGVEARRAGVPYRCPRIFHPGLSAEQALEALIQEEIESFGPNAVVYLTAESVMGRAMTEGAYRNGIPAVGLQTFFKRDSVVVHRAGLDWWKVLRDLPLPAGSGANNRHVLSKPSSGFSSAQTPRAPPARIWAGRAERAFRAVLGSAHDQPFGDFSTWLAGRIAPRTDLCSPKWRQATEAFSTPPVLVAIHRPTLSHGEPDWLDLICFALAAIPPEIPLVLRPHPDERPKNLPAELFERLTSRGIQVSRKGRGPDLGQLISQARLVITLNSAVGMQALVEGVPVVTNVPTYYSRFGMAQYNEVDRPERLRSLLLSDSLCRPDPEIVRSFEEEVVQRFSATLPACTSGIVPATELASCILRCLKNPVEMGVAA